MQKKTTPISHEERLEIMTFVVTEPRYDQCLFVMDEWENEGEKQVFSECIFQNVTLQGDFSQCEFVDVIFDHCDLSNCQFARSIFHRVEWKHCKMIGTDFSQCAFRHVFFTTCLMRYANFNASKWEDGICKDCDATEASFSLLEWKQMVLEQCNFTACELIGTSLENIDLSSCQIEGITVQAENLKGAIMNEQQALLCAKLLGITVKY